MSRMNESCRMACKRVASTVHTEHDSFIRDMTRSTMISFAKEPYKRDDILQKRPVILRSLLIVATPYDQRVPPQYKGDSFICDMGWL